MTERFGPRYRPRYRNADGEKERCGTCKFSKEVSDRHDIEVEGVLACHGEFAVVPDPVLVNQDCVCDKHRYG